MNLVHAMPSRSEIGQVNLLLDLEPVPDVLANQPEGLVWAEFRRVGGGSTAWVNLLAACETATDYPDGDTAEVSVAWGVAWNQYHTAQGQLSEADRQLSYAYDLGELGVCRWCQTRDTDENLSTYGRVGEPTWYTHPSCLAENLREQGL